MTSGSSLCCFGRSEKLHTAKMHTAKKTRKILNVSHISSCSFLAFSIVQKMKISALVVFSAIASASAFAPSAAGPKSMALNAEAEQSRSAFLAAAGAAVFGAVGAPGVAGAMDQENVSTPTEVWETGKPSEASKERKARYENARNQMNSNFPPIKRLTLERKSPVTRLDLNAPDFNGYKKTYPGLFK